jgi:hypothetical protein
MVMMVAPVVNESPPKSNLLSTWHEIPSEEEQDFESLRRRVTEMPFPAVESPQISIDSKRNDDIERLGPVVSDQEEQKPIVSHTLSPRN